MIRFIRVVALLLSLVVGHAAAAQDASSPPAPVATAAEQARLLVDALGDADTRAALIAELEKVAGDAPPDGGGEGDDAPNGEGIAEVVGAVEAAAPPDATADDGGSEFVSFGRNLARLTKDAAEDLMARAQDVGDRLLALPDTFVALESERNIPVLIEALKNLALTILLTYVTFILLRRIMHPFYKAMGERAAGQGALQTFILIAVSTVVDALVVIVAWAVGYIIVLSMLGSFGEMQIRQTLYLNAFLIVEMVKVAMRFVLSPTAGELRLVAIGDRAARYLSRWLTVLISILGYGQLLVIPIVNQQVSFTAGGAMSVLISLVALLVALGLVLRNRRRVADWLSNEEMHPEQRGLLRFLALHWHWPVILYLAALFVIVATRPDGMLFPVLGASGKILLAILAGMIVTGAITRAISHGVHLPPPVTARLPLLEGRLNRFVPTTLMVIRVAVVLAVLAFTADVLGFVDMEGWLESRVGVAMTGRIISTAFTILIGFVLWLALTSWIDWRLNPEYGSVPTARETTLLSLLRNAATIAILIITVMFALSNMGLDIAPLLASAGVLGLAIGFGSQKLVQDIITGIFIQFESAINVGDVITVSGTTGTVERLTIRSVSLRDLHGAYHIIPFSSVDMVTNFMRDFAYFVCDMGVAYRENTDEVRDAMMDAFDELAGDVAIEGKLLGSMEWMGVTTFGDNAVTVRTRLKTRPGAQWATGRAYNAIVKRVFDERGIEMPFPHRTIYFGEDKNGEAPAAKIDVEERRLVAVEPTRDARADRGDALADGPPESGEQL